MSEADAFLEFARELAEIGGRIAMGHYRPLPETKRKDDGTWVTEADWKAEAQIRLRIARTFPEHNILGEEEGLTAAGGGPPVNGAPTWVLDPIDGTNNYIAGIPIWATLVGLQVDGEASSEWHTHPLSARPMTVRSGRCTDERRRDLNGPSRTSPKATVLFADAGSFRVAGSTSSSMTRIARGARVGSETSGGTCSWRGAPLTSWSNPSCGLGCRRAGTDRHRSGRSADTAGRLAVPRRRNLSDD